MLDFLVIADGVDVDEREGRCDQVLLVNEEQIMTGIPECFRKRVL